MTPENTRENTPETAPAKPHITLVMVMSVNGVVSRADGESVAVWSSTEDKAHLAYMIESTGAFVTGRRSFNPARKFKKPVRRYVMTRDAQAAGLSPDSGAIPVEGTVGEILKRMAQDGVARALLLGGPSVNAQFFEAGAVDEVVITVEPHLFARGLPLVNGMARHVKLTFISAETLNTSGTILLRYEVIKDGE